MKPLNLLLMLLLLAAPVGAGAAEYFQYETDDGVVAFVDDAKKIPTKYRDSARELTHGALEDYDRLTITEKGARATAAPAVDPGSRHDARPIITRHKEFRWVDGAFGAPGDVYARVEVISYDGEEVWVELHDPDTVRVVDDDLRRPLR